MTVATKPLTILSMGWGVQTWTLAAMIALGEHERPDFIVFADTGHEGQATYEFARQWTPWLQEHGLTVVTVHGKRVDVIMDEWANSVMIPAFTVSNETGARGQLRRQCTHDWKIVPIRHWLREELVRRTLKTTPGCIESWQGISWDEFQRMRDSDVQYIENRYPLVDLRMTREGCIQWCKDHDLPVAPKSACTFCPYGSVERWKQTKRQAGADWEEAVSVDEAIRNKRFTQHGPMFVHPARVPLPQAVRIPEDEGAHQMEMGIECEGGYCHV